MMNEDAVYAIGTLFANLSLFGGMAFVFSYALFFKWYGTPAGRSIMGFVSSVVALAFLSFLTRTLGDQDVYDVIRMFVMAYVCIATFGLLVTLWLTWLRTPPDGLKTDPKMSFAALTQLEKEKRMTRSDKIVGLIRTYTPAAVGAFVAWLITKIPAVADVLGGINESLLQAGFVGTTAEGILIALAIAGVTGAYYWIVRTAGSRWPWVERFLGSKQAPVYLKTADDSEKVEDALPDAANREVIDTAGANVILADAEASLISNGKHSA